MKGLARLWDVVGRLVRRVPTTDLLDALDRAHTRLIVGLGNPGPEYAKTRHNVGFRCVEEIARRANASWATYKTDLNSLLAVAHLDDDTSVVLAKPQTFMNRSGAAVQELLERLDLNPGQCLIVYDDMDLPFGALRLRERGSPGTHNGMRSVLASVHTEAVPRLRIGISQAAPGAATDHVLSEFEPDECDAVDELIARAADAVSAWAIDGAAVAMNRYNKA